MQSTLWGITTLFNPSRAQARIDNYRAFRVRSLAQGLPLATVELAFGDAPFELEPGKDAEILIQRRSTSVLWQKERLLNLALAKLPADCSQVCWADADILFHDDDWVAKTSSLLKRSVVVQPFSECIRLPEGGAMAAFPADQLDKAVPAGDGEGTYAKTICYRMGKWRNPVFSGSTGYVWSAQRALLDEVGFYDRCIVGGADREMALAFYYPPGQVPKERRKITHPGLIEHIGKWHERVYPLVRGKVKFRKGVVYHLFHGAAAKRGYVDRHAILAEQSFDPDRDIAIDEQGCWRFDGENPRLQKAISDYFQSRKETK